MNRLSAKTETLNLRVSIKLKEALRIASEREHRSMANMIEFLVLDYCEQRGIKNNLFNKDDSTEI